MIPLSLSEEGTQDAVLSQNEDTFVEEILKDDDEEEVVREIVFNRPFLFIVVDSRKHLPLIVSRITEPIGNNDIGYLDLFGGEKK